MTYVWSTSTSHSFPVFCRHLRMFTIISRQNKTLGGKENLLDIQVGVCYILKHLEDRKAWSVHIHYTWCDIILIFKLHRRTRLTPRSSIHSLKIRMPSHPCDKYEQITLSYFLSTWLQMALCHRVCYKWSNSPKVTGKTGYSTATSESNRHGMDHKKCILKTISTTNSFIFSWSK